MEDDNVLEMPTIDREQGRMYDLLRQVFIRISFINPNCMNSINSDYLNIFIEHESRTLIRVFGFDLCKYNAEKILDYEIFPFDKDSDLTSFGKFCKMTFDLVTNK